MVLKDLQARQPRDARLSHRGRDTFLHRPGEEVGVPVPDAGGVHPASDSGEPDPPLFGWRLLRKDDPRIPQALGRNADQFQRVVDRSVLDLIRVCRHVRSGELHKEAEFHDLADKLLAVGIYNAEMRNPNNVTREPSSNIG